MDRMRRERDELEEELRRAKRLAIDPEVGIQAAVETAACLQAKAKRLGQCRIPDMV